MNARYEELTVLLAMLQVGRDNAYRAGRTATVRAIDAQMMTAIAERDSWTAQAARA